MSSSPKCSRPTAAPTGSCSRQAKTRMASRAGAFVVGAIHIARHALSAGIHSGPVVRVGEFTHPAKQKTIRSIHPIDDFAKNWLFKQSGVTLI